MPILGYANTLYFAGISFVGNANQDHRYPYAQQFFNHDSLQINKNIRQALNALNRPDLNISDNLGDISSGDAKVVTLSIQSETLERLQEKNGVYSFYNVLASVMIFDMAEKKILNNYPIAIQHQEFTTNMPTPDQDRQVFKKIYYDSDFKGSLVKAWGDKLQTLKINTASPLHIQINSLQIDDATHAQLPDRLKHNDIFRVQTAQLFESLLASNQNVPILPFTIGRLGNKSNGLVARFADGISYDLTLPRADFHIDILIRKFKQANINTNSYSGHIFGSFITMTVKEPLSDTVFLNSKFNWKNKVVFAKSDNIIITDPWDMYLKSQKILFSKITKQISAQDKAVLKTITNTPNIKQQFIKFQEILEKCRT